MVEGIDHFDSAPIQACDLRAGAAMVIVALAAHGTTEVSCVNYIERGYEDIVGKLRALGANIRVEEVSDDTGPALSALAEQPENAHGRTGGSRGAPLGVFCLRPA